MPPSTGWASPTLGPLRSWPSHLINHRPVSRLVNHQQPAEAIHPGPGGRRPAGLCAPHCANCACRTLSKLPGSWQATAPWAVPG